MKTFKSLLPVFLGFALSVMLFGAWHLYAQQSQPATLVQQTATHLDTCTWANGTASSGSTATLTIPAPPNGQYIYINEIDLEIATSASATASNEVVTTTNMPNSLQWAIGLQASTGGLATLSMFYPTAMKSLAPGTKVTIAGPSGATGMLQNFNACYWNGY